MIKAIQINLNRSFLARELLYAKAANDSVDIILTSEPPRGPPDSPRRFTSPDGLCGIILTRTLNFVAESHGAAPGHCWIKTGALYVFSCYFSPNSTLVDFIQKLSYLQEALRQIPAEMEVVIGGDFNAKSFARGFRNEDVRGQTLTELMIEMGLMPAYVGNVSIFRKANSESVIDVTFCREGSRIITDWRVSEEFSGSDHMNITFKIDDARDH